MLYGACECFLVGFDALGACAAAWALDACAGFAEAFALE
jgi:hypothetical protein